MTTTADTARTAATPDMTQYPAPTPAPAPPAPVPEDDIVVYSDNLLFAASSPDAAINDMGTVRDPLTITMEQQDMRIGALVVGIDLEHSYIGDLTVTLVSPDQSQSVLLHRSGGSADGIHQFFTTDDFNGAPVDGTWTLVVEDQQAEDSGILESWTMTVFAEQGGAVPTPPHPPMAPGWDA